ncbi:MAG: DUF559 domain-containing protein [Gammaproteobacteria bacterium]
MPIGAYIVDFICLEKRLIIDLDKVASSPLGTLAGHVFRAPLPGFSTPCFCR